MWTQAESGNGEIRRKGSVLPRCGAPYVDPQIIELATISERSRESHRLKYATRMNQRMNALAAVIITVALTMFVSTGAVHGLLTMALLTLGVYIAINVVGFLVRYYIVFPKLLKDSAQRMNDTWYLARLKACKAA